MSLQHRHRGALGNFLFGALEAGWLTRARGHRTVPDGNLLPVLHSARDNRMPEQLPHRRMPAPRYRRTDALDASRLGKPVTTTAARSLNRAAGTLSLAVLLDSGLEHYRGAFKNPAMYTPLLISSLTLAASLHGSADARRESHLARHSLYGAAALTGIAGTGFHIFNILKRPGRLAWQNLFYGAPVGAPMAIMLSGLLGAAAERVRDTTSGTTPRLLGIPAGRALAAVSSAGILGTVGEVGLLHFRGAYHSPVMYLPVTIPPVAAVLLARAALGTAETKRGLTVWWLRLTALLGFVGVGFHAWGVSRNMGGWRNWSQNILSGPPLPAPPSFTGLALAGLAALKLLKDQRHD